MENFDALKAATLGAQQIQAPTSNLGASNAAELALLNKSSFQLPQSQGAANAAGNIAGDVVAAQRAAAAAAARKAADQSDPSKYRKVKKADGGFDFYDPDGNQIDIATLSQKTQTKPGDWIDDSENPIDIQYREQKKDLEKYIAAKVGGDKKTSDAYEASDPELKKYQGQGGAHQLINDFQKAFQRYYVPRSQNPNAWGAQNGSNFFSGNDTTSPEDQAYQDLVNGG